MEFSEDWKTPWTISTVFSAPKLLRSGSTVVDFGPLQFYPFSAPHILASFPSLASPINPPVARNVFLDDLHSYFRSVPDDFVPISLQNELLPSLLPTNEDPIPTNRLQGLLFRDGTTLALFFPTGENAHHVGYVTLDLTGPVPKLLANDGDVFEVGAGYRHPYHRITEISVNPADADSRGGSVSAIEGYVLAASLYSVSWFKVESSELCTGDPVKRPLVASMGKQGFKSRVVHACWNPHFKEEMAVLLENGKLVHIDVDTKRGVTFDVHTGVESDCFLSCAFGGQPWVVMVASAMAVGMVDLRSRAGEEPAVLARVQDLVHFTVPREIKNDRFIGFCRASFDHLYFSVVTENQLILYDVRQPRYPILAWDHGMPHPSHVSMHKLSDFRPSKKFSWASDSGYAILLGSFWNDRFKLFCYGPMSERCSKTSSLYAWELPSSISLSGHQCSSPADALRDEFKNRDQTGLPWQMKEELILGFYVDPRNSLEFQPENHTFEGFGLIRLLSSGKLELQRYSASLKEVTRKNDRKRMSSEVPDLPHHHWDYDDVVPRQLDYFKINFLTAYIEDNLFEAIIKGLDNPLSYGTNIKGLECKRDLWELINNMPRPTMATSLSENLADVSFPSSIHDIAMRRVLSSLPTNLLYLAFSNYQVIFGDLSCNFEFYEAPQLLHGKQLSHYFTRKPSTKVAICKAPQNYLVGPSLPVPVLLILERALHADGIKSFQDCPDDNLLGWNCNLIQKEILHATVDRKKNGLGLQDDTQESESKTPYFVYESPTDSSLHNEVALKTNGCLAQSDTGPKDKNFATFISASFTSDHRIPPRGGSDGDLFDDSNQFRLDYESQEMNFSVEEHKVFQLLGRQFKKWRGTLPYYQEFCRDKKIK